MPVGQLTVELQASVAKFQTDLQQASSHARQAAGEIDRVFGELKSHLLEVGAALGVAFSAGAFVDTIKGAIEAEAALKDLGARAGLTGEQFSSFTRAARQSNTDLEAVASMSARLSKALIESQDANSKSAAVLHALGITSADTAKLLADPVLAVTTLSKRLNELPEGGTKAAAQLLILGRAGGNTSAFMRELAEQQTVQASRTQAQIDAAKKLTDQFIDLQIKSDNLKTSLANGLVKTLSDVVVAFEKVSSETGGVAAALSKVTASGELQEWAQNAAIAVGTVAESIVFVGRAANALKGSVDVVVADLKVLTTGANAPVNKPLGALGFSKEDADTSNKAFRDAVAERNAILANADENYKGLITKNATAFTDALRAQFSKTNTQPNADVEPLGNADRVVTRIQDAANAAAKRAKAVQDAVAGASRGAAGDDPTKKILEGDLAALESSIGIEKQLLGTRKEFLTEYYQQGFISTKEFYDKQRDVVTESLAFETTQRNKQIAELEQYANRRDQTEVNRQDARNKIIEIQKRQATADEEAAKQGTLLWFQEQAAAKQYQRTLVDISAQLLTLQNNTAAATRLRLTSQNEDLRKQLTLEGNTSGLSQLDEIEARTVAQAKLNDQQKIYGDVLQDLGNIQGRIDLQQATGAITELDALKQKGEAAAAYARALQPVVDAYLRIAIAAKDPAAIIAAQRLQLELDTLAAQADLLAKKFTDVFVNSFTDAIANFVDGTKSLKDTIKDLAKTLDQQLVHIAAQNVSEQLFGKGGPASGVGDFFAKIFGGGGKAGESAALSTAGTTLTTAGGQLSAAASALLSAASTLGASSAGGGFGSLFTGDAGGGGFGTGADFGNLDFGGFFASGTNYVQKDMLAVVHKGEAIVPAKFNASNGEKRGYGGVTIHQTFAPGTDSATVHQAAIAAGRELRKAQARR